MGFGLNLAADDTLSVVTSDFMAPPVQYYVTTFVVVDTSCSGDPDAETIAEQVIDVPVAGTILAIASADVTVISLTADVYTLHGLALSSTAAADAGDESYIAHRYDPDALPDLQGEVITGVFAVDAGIHTVYWRGCATRSEYHYFYRPRLALTFTPG